MFMISPETSEKTSSAAAPDSSAQSTSIPISLWERASRPCSFRSSRSVFRSGIRAASTWIVLDIPCSLRSVPRIQYVSIWAPRQTQERVSDPIVARAQPDRNRYFPVHGGRGRPGARPLHQRRDGRAGGRRDPGAPRARHRRAAGPRCARRRGRHRPRGRGCAGRPRRAVGQDAAERALPSAARARRRDRREPQGTHRARVAQCRQGDLVGEGGGRRRRRELPLLRVGDRLDRRPLESDRRLAPHVLPQRARRRLRADRAVELPAPDGRLEVVAGPRRRLHGRPQAGPADAAERAADRRARKRDWLPAGAINVVPGDGPSTGAYLVRHHGVDKVAFTGSTRTGGEIMRLCSEPIKRLTLELGGKSPNLVFADANLDDAIPSSVWSIYYSAGQSCEARSRVLVEQSLYDEFVSRFADYAKQIRVGDPLDPETQMGSLISTAHRDRVHSFVERGRKEGAEVVAGGEFGDGKGAFYRPTVLAKVDNAMEVAQEEIFGPVVTVIPFEDEKDAIRIANDVKYGLFATVWTGDPARGHRLARAIKAGQIGINMPYTAFPGIPFGGYKQSGFGRELGLETLELYLETKGVLVSTSPKPFNPFGL